MGGSWYGQIKLAYTLDYLRKRFPEDEITWAGTMSQNPTYMFWILNQAKRGKIIKGEDEEHVKEALGIFERAKRLPNFTQKDINQFKEKSDLFAAIEPFREVKSKRQDASDKRNAGLTVMAEDGPWQMLRCDTFEATKPLAMKTQWCVSVASHYNNYSKMGPLYMILHHGSPIALLHQPSHQFKNANDGSMTIGETSPMLDFLNGILPSLVKHYPGELSVVPRCNEERKKVLNMIQSGDARGLKHIVTTNPEYVTLLPKETLETPLGQQLVSDAKSTYYAELVHSHSVVGTWREVPDMLKDADMIDFAAKQFIKKDFTANYRNFSKLTNDLKTPELINLAREEYQKNYFDENSHPVDYEDIPPELVTDAEKQRYAEFWSKALQENPEAYSVGMTDPREMFSHSDDSTDRIKLPTELRKAVRPAADAAWEKLFANPDAFWQTINEFGFTAIPDYMRGKIAKQMVPKVLEMLDRDLQECKQVYHFEPHEIPPEYLKIPEVAQAWHNYWAQALASKNDPTILPRSNLGKKMMRDPVLLDMFRKAWINKLRSDASAWGDYTHYDDDYRRTVDQQIPVELENDPAIRKALYTGATRNVLRGENEPMPGFLDEDPKIQEARKRNYYRRARKNNKEYPFINMNAEYDLGELNKLKTMFTQPQGELDQTNRQKLFDTWDTEMEPKAKKLNEQMDVVNSPKMKRLWQTRTKPWIIEQINAASPFHIQSMFPLNHLVRDPDVMQALSAKFQQAVPTMQQNPTLYSSLAVALRELPEAKKFKTTVYMPYISDKMIAEMKNALSAPCTNERSATQISGQLSTIWYNTPYEARDESNILSVAIRSLWTQYLVNKLQAVQSGTDAGYMPSPPAVGSNGEIGQLTNQIYSLRMQQSKQRKLTQNVQ